MSRGQRIAKSRPARRFHFDVHSSQNSLDRHFTQWYLRVHFNNYYYYYFSSKSTFEFLVTTDVMNIFESFYRWGSGYVYKIKMVQILYKKPCAQEVYFPYSCHLYENHCRATDAFFFSDQNRPGYLLTKVVNLIVSYECLVAIARVAKTTKYLPTFFTSAIWKTN